MPEKKNNFEEQLDQLQQIVSKLETGNVPLEDALDEFRVGVQLSQDLEKKLTEAEQTVAKLIDKNGNEKSLNPEDASAPED